MNTDYGLRPVAHDEIRSAFGSLSRCMEITGGDLNLVLLYLHNPERIADAPPPSPTTGRVGRRAARGCAVRACRRSLRRAGKAFYQGHQRDGRRLSASRAPGAGRCWALAAAAGGALT